MVLEGSISTSIPPDLILLDLMLPSVDGLTLCQRLRRDERTSNIPILMITALGGLKDKLLDLIRELMIVLLSLLIWKNYMFA